MAANRYRDWSWSNRADYLPAHQPRDARVPLRPVPHPPLAEHVEVVAIILPDDVYVGERTLVTYRLWRAEVQANPHVPDPDPTKVFFELREIREIVTLVEFA